jgi:hypothetical protein
LRLTGGAGVICNNERADRKYPVEITLLFREEKRRLSIRESVPPLGPVVWEGIGSG